MLHTVQKTEDDNDGMTVHELRKNEKHIVTPYCIDLSSELVLQLTNKPRNEQLIKQYLRKNGKYSDV